MLSITRRWATTALLVAATGLGVAACGSDDGGSTGTSAGSGSASSAATGVERRTIGYVDQLHAGAMQQRWYNYFKAAADRLGWEVRLQDAKGDPALGLTQATNFVNQGVDAVVISCLDTAPMRQAIEAAKSKDIPIIGLGCPTPQPEQWSAVYAEDEAALSETLAEYVIGEAPPEGAETAILYDTQLLAGRIRHEVFRETLEGSDVRIVGEEVVDLTNIEATSRAAASAFLNSNPNLSSIISVYDYFAPPAVSAIQDAGRQGEVEVYGYYADAHNLPILLKPNSPLTALVDGPVEQVSLVAVDQLLAHFESDAELDSSAASQLDITYDIFTRENAPKYTKDFVTPYPVEKYLEPYVERWQQEYGLQ